MPYKILRLNLDALPSSNVLGREISLPDFPVVYVIFSRSEVFYVGATKSLYRRWSAHRNEPKFAQTLRRSDVRVGWVAVQIEQLNSFATALIRFFNPKLNERPNRRTYYHANHGRWRRPNYQRLKRATEPR